MNPKRFLKLRSKAIVFIDWANVHGWSKSLKRPVNPKKLYKYLKIYPEINEINFYYGTDDNVKSKAFLKTVKQIGYKVKTKPVKHIIVGKVGETVVKRRKCDFDIEICMAVYYYLNLHFISFIFFTGDGDFSPLYQYLISLGKQVIVIYQKGHLGREVWELKKGIFKTEIKRFPVF